MIGEGEMRYALVDKRGSDWGCFESLEEAENSLAMMKRIWRKYDKRSMMPETEILPCKHNHGLKGASNDTR